MVKKRVLVLHDVADRLKRDASEKNYQIRSDNNWVIFSLHFLKIYILFRSRRIKTLQQTTDTWCSEN